MSSYAMERELTKRQLPTFRLTFQIVMTVTNVKSGSLGAIPFYSRQCGDDYTERLKCRIDSPIIQELRNHNLKVRIRQESTM